MLPYINQQKVVNDCYGVNGNRSYHDFSAEIKVCRLASCKKRNMKRHNVKCHLGCYLFGCVFVTKVFVAYINRIYNNWKDPLDGFLLLVSIQEEVDCGICNAYFFLYSIKQHLKTHSHSIARSARNISYFNTQFFKFQDALT